MRPTPDATFSGKPSATFRNGTRNTPPPSPSIEPRPPAAAPAAITRATMRPVISGKAAEAGWSGRAAGRSRRGVYDGPDLHGILVHVPALLRRRPRAELVSHRVRPNTAGSRDRPAARHRRLCERRTRPPGLTITHAIDTHIHADFVSGSRELAAIGAEVIAGPGAGLALRARRSGARRIDSASRRRRAAVPAHPGTHARAHLDRRSPSRRAAARLHRRHAVCRRGRPSRSARRGGDAARSPDQLYDSLFTTLMRAAGRR